MFFAQLGVFLVVAGMLALGAGLFEPYKSYFYVGMIALSLVGIAFVDRGPWNLPFMFGVIALSGILYTIRRLRVR